MVYQNLMALPKACTSRIISSQSINKNIIINHLNKLFSLSFENNISTHQSSSSNNDINSESTKHVASQKRLTLRNLRKINSMYLTDGNEAKKFINLIRDDLLKNMSHVIEINPGPGFITEQLLQSGVPFVHLYDTHSDYWQDKLERLNEKFPNRFNMTKFNLCQIINYSYISPNNKIYKVLKDEEYRQWDEKSCMQIVGAIADKGYLKHLITCTVFQKGLMMYGRPIFYFALTKSEFIKFTQISSPSKRNYILFNTIFNYKVFGTLNRNAFIPSHKPRNKRFTKNALMDNNLFLIVIKIEPKPDLFKVFGTTKNLIHFWHFIQHAFYNPNNRVIPFFEQIVPGCGIRLIKLDYNICTQFKELNLNQVYGLYKELQSWPEYGESIFGLGVVLSNLHNFSSSYVEEEEEDKAEKDQEEEVNEGR